MSKHRALWLTYSKRGPGVWQPWAQLCSHVCDHERAGEMLRFWPFQSIPLMMAISRSSVLQCTWFKSPCFMSNYLLKVHPCSPQTCPWALVFFFSSPLLFRLMLRFNKHAIESLCFFEVTGTLRPGAALFLALVREIKMFRCGVGAGQGGMGSDRWEQCFLKLINFAFRFHSLTVHYL